VQHIFQLFSGQPETGAQLPPFLPRHGPESDGRPAEIRREVIVDETPAVVPQGQLGQLLLVGVEADNRAVVVAPLDNVPLLPVLAHEFRERMTPLRNALALGEPTVCDDVEGLIH